MNPYLAHRAFGGRRILVGVCGGIAAYKIAELVGLLVQAGAEVRVAMTPESTRFIAPLTFEALSGNPVASDLFGPQRAQAEGGEAHIALSDWPEAIVLAPATANVIAKLAHGLADEIVSTTVLASNAPLVLAPAMHTRMWQQAATGANIETLRQRGVSFAGPVEGRLASGEVGIGRLADSELVLRAIRDALPGVRDMAGLTVVVTAGGTREPLDPVRFIGNHSSGLMGHSLAAVAEARGARTILVTTTGMPVAAGVDRVQVETAEEMLEAVSAQVGAADLLVMAAAVADFRPRERAGTKLSKTEMPGALELEHTTDILASIPPGQARRLVKIGFAAETHDVVAHAQEKLMAKGLDMIVANDVSNPEIGMGSPDNAVTLITRTERREVGRAAKEEIADRILDAALLLLRPGDTSGSKEAAS
ncbi:MAG TPA: bifunctional phosphopantothenoylcysteine decarboxylase/phosphopantothenate--cysteine ligase CoaBC [Candidatus Dormibacteraeota bacterium]|nr:bifunctional phosphopantothenoylcysteine decarboxylase/phosphopantothenate--cysteine ligase CoaBC [Candidatus Dormibacteraeota bacterium]